MTVERRSTIVTIFVAGALLACAGGDEDNAASDRTNGEPPPVTTIGAAEDSFTVEELNRGRLDPSWRRYLGARLVRRGGTDSLRDTTRSAAGDTALDQWEEISPATVNGGGVRLPLRGDVSGPDVVRVQTLLDRTSFSPGILDGRWGKNTEKAVYWFQQASGMDATGEVDRLTLQRLDSAAGSPSRAVLERSLTQEDVSGPFVQLPEDVYERAEMECLCYESLTEKLAERFHSSPALLRQLNPGVDLDALSAGDRLSVPAVRDVEAGRRGEIARVVISDGGHWLHALDESGAILYHFPSTLGSDYAPSPTGDFSITAIVPDPTWHYQPSLLTGVPDDRPDAVLPPGPNNAVGVVWMQLSKDHYGMHGTAAPETIGYVTSHGCVRLTNWDASFLAERFSAGTPVEFRDAS